MAHGSHSIRAHWGRSSRLIHGSFRDAACGLHVRAKGRRDGALVDNYRRGGHGTPRSDGLDRTNLRAGAAPLNAIGNEAVYCAADLRRGELGERAIGRVRDQVFTIDMNSTLKDDPILTREALKTRIYTAAEQVAGNLF